MTPSRLARQLLVALADLVHPHGRIDSDRTVECYLSAWRAFAASLTEVGFTGGVEQLSRSLLVEVWMRSVHRTESYTRIMLRRYDDLHGVMDIDVRRLIDGRMFNANPRHTRNTLPPYTESEWSRLISAARASIEPSIKGHRRALAQAESGANPRVSGWSEATIQWMLLHGGPDTSQVLGQTVRRCRNRPGAVPANLYPGGIVEALSGLFPTGEVVKAYQILFGAYCGIVPDGLADLGLGDIEWAGDSTVLLDYVKGRTARETLTLPPRATRLLEQWLEHSSVTRRHAPAALRSRLWVRFLPTGHDRWASGPVASNEKWVRRAGLLDDSGAALRLHAHRVRTTFESLKDRRRWRGSPRATIDPNHSPQVEGDHYLQVATPAQKDAVEDIIAGAQHDLVRRAQPPTMSDTEDVAQFVERYPELVERWLLDDEVLAELLAGERDVFTAACADQLAGLHGPAGKPCPARPWVCLLCPLAVFAPRHLPNLFRLKAFFARQWAQMPAPQFMAVFGPHAQRLDQVLGSPVFTARDLESAALRVDGTDRELPLHPEEFTR
ncbi:hypothetical protein [Nocardia noduli]|uniref:hypothetical protein n=1 Tax=Nocardia noduli TaxID=2815722 RepID=UPI0027DF943E|nr:hypothetical protein [Nocardia noduli]